MSHLLHHARRIALPAVSFALVMLCGVMLSPQADAQAVTFSPSTLSWYNTQIGVTSGAKTVTVTNNESDPLTISSIAVGSNFVESASTCPISPSTLAVGSSCTISVEFRPLSQGALSASLTVNDDAAGSPQTVSLSGTGVVGPMLYSPTSLSFTTTSGGTMSAAKTATLTNTSSSPQAIRSISKWGLFEETNNCPSTLAAQASCTISVTFNPTSTAAVTGAVQVNYGTESGDDLFLSGSGASGAVTLTPTSSNFGSEQVGSTTAPQSFTLTNSETTAVTISSVATSLSDFISSTNCPLSPNTLAANSSCDVMVSFDPTTSGTRSGTLTVSSNAAGSPAIASLTGTGTVSTPSNAVGFSPASLSFANTYMGTAAGAKTVSITNEQSVPLTISSITTGQDYFQSASNCPIAPSTLAAGASCSVSVRFRPLSSGTLSESLSINDNAAGSPQTLMLSGTGVVGPLLYSPTSLTFNASSNGTAIPPQTATLTNTTSSPLAITSFSGWGPFVQSNNCPISPNTLASQASCTVSVTFNPTSANMVTGGIQANFGTNSGIDLYVTGTGSSGTTGGGGPLTLSPSNGFFFNGQIYKRPSTPQTLKVYNGNSSSITVSSVSSSNSSYIQTNNCIGTLAPYGSCSVSITFDPQTTGTITGSISILSSGSSSAQSVSMTGTGIAGDAGAYVIVSPQYSCVQPSHSEQFSAIVGNASNTVVNWSVDGVSNGNNTVGTITTGGLYTAPASGGAHTITAVSQAASYASGYSPLTVTTSLIFDINPFFASMTPGSTQLFQGQICGVPDDGPVTYSVDGIDGGNATVGTITSSGTYTAPATAGRHSINVTDTALNKSSAASATIYSDISVDFGSRTNTTYPIPPDMLGANHDEFLYSTAALDLLPAAGITITRTPAQMQIVYATQTANWSPIDSIMQNFQAAGIHPILQMELTPPWLQPSPNPCAAPYTVTPTNVTAWGQLAASYVAHMDSKFPGLVQDYEIWNEPDVGNLCDRSLSDYLSIYGAAAPLMKQQARTDGVSIRIGGPASAGLDSTWISALVSNSSTAPYVDFISYHQYLFSPSYAEALWDSYDATTSVYQRTQDIGIGAAALFTKASQLAKNGSQPLGAKTPIYVDEFNINYAYMQTCCQNDPTYAPLWNALYIADILNSVYTGNAAVPGKLVYYAASVYPYFCLVGNWDTHMDCQDSIGSTPVPYPQYYAYQLLSSSNYLDMQDGGDMAASITPPTGGGGIAVTAFYTHNKDSILIVNPTSTSYQQMTVNLLNIGYTSPQATLYQIVNGNTINPSTLALSANGSAYTATITVPAYTVMGISIQ